jgi:hypothetical protein
VKSQQLRLKTIELSLTPEQIVLVRHEAAKEAGSLVEAALISPAPRQAIANAVNNAIRVSMKGQHEAAIESAIQQGRQQADFLFMLIVETNAGVRGNAAQKIFMSRASELFAQSSSLHCQPAGGEALPDPVCGAVQIVDNDGAGFERHRTIYHIRYLFAHAWMSWQNFRLWDCLAVKRINRKTRIGMPQGRQLRAHNQVFLGSERKPLCHRAGSTICGLVAGEVFGRGRIAP